MRLLVKDNSWKHITDTCSHVPPRRPPATVKEIAINLATPTTKACQGLSISNPINPVVGQIFGKSFAGAMFATIWISSSPQKAKLKHGRIRFVSRNTRD